MTYIGQQPATTFDAGIQDRFTGLSTNTVTLNHEIAAEEDILVVWNNIVQDKNTYSVGGTGNKTLTLGGTLASADVVTVYYLNKVMQSVNPTAGSVNTDQLAASAVTDAKIADVAASKLTGTIATARLGSGTASSSTFLRGDSTFAEAGGGGFEFIKASRSTSSAAAVQLNDIISSDYDHYRVVGTCVPASDNQDFFINARTGTPTNDNYTGSNAYTWEYGARYRNTSGGGSYTNGSMTDTKWKFGDNVDADADSHYIAFDMMLYDWGTQIHTRCMWRGAMINNQDSSSGIHIGYGGGKLTSNINATGINFSFSGGNVAEHSVSVFGLKKA